MATEKTLKSGFRENNIFYYTEAKLSSQKQTEVTNTMNTTIAKAETKHSKENIMQNLVTDDSLNTLNTAIDIVKKEYGDYKLTREMRQAMAEELGVSNECADRWQKVADILDHVDMNELAKRHPEAIGKVSKSIVGIIACIFPAARFAETVSEDYLAKIVEFAGILSPEHLANIYIKKHIEKSKAKSERAEIADAEPKHPSKFTIFKGKLSDGYKNTADKLSGLFTKKDNTPALPQNEDIFESIRKLSELKNNGIITQEEFDVKKTELLERI